MTYAIHILQLIVGLIPWYLRKELLVDWLDCLLHPLQHLNDKLVKKKMGKKKRSTIFQ